MHRIARRTLSSVSTGSRAQLIMSFSRSACDRRDCKQEESDLMQLIIKKQYLKSLALSTSMLGSLIYCPCGDCMSSVWAEGERVTDLFHSATGKVQITARPRGLLSLFVYFFLKNKFTWHKEKGWIGHVRPVNMLGTLQDQVVPPDLVFGMSQVSSEMNRCHTFHSYRANYLLC